MNLKKAKLNCLSLILILILSMGLSGCTNSTTNKDSEQVEEVEEAEIETVLAAIKTSYIEDDILSYKTTLDFEHDKEIIFQNKYSDMEGILTFRGNSLRNSPSFGQADLNKKELEVALIHPASAGHGLNLQEGGNTLVWFGLTWSLELYQQTNARLYRQGQTDSTVVIQHIITKGTIDEDIMKALERKDKTQTALIDAVKANIKGRK